MLCNTCTPSNSMFSSGEPKFHSCRLSNYFCSRHQTSKSFCIFLGCHSWQVSSFLLSLKNKLLSQLLNDYYHAPIILLRTCVFSKFNELHCIRLNYQSVTSCQGCNSRKINLCLIIHCFTVVYSHQLGLLNISSPQELLAIL
jgi:hypothetical protein